MNRPYCERGMPGKKLALKISAGICLMAGIQFSEAVLLAEGSSEQVWNFNTTVGVELDAATSSYRISPEEDQIVGQWVFPEESVVGVFDVLPAAGNAPCFSFGQIQFTYGSDANGRVELYYRDQTESDWLPTRVYARDEIGWRTIEVRALTSQPPQLILDNTIVFEIQDPVLSPVLNLFVEAGSETYLSEPYLFGPPPAVGSVVVEEEGPEAEPTPAYTVSRKGVEIDYTQLQSKLVEKGIKLPSGVLDPRNLPLSKFVKVLEENAPPARGVVGKPSSYGFDVSEKK